MRVVGEAGAGADAGGNGVAAAEALAGALGHAAVVGSVRGARLFLAGACA